jgi:hypothetical protein
VAFKEMCREATFRDFVNLYLAEGYKRSRNDVALANSDPAVIKIAARWIRQLSQNRVDFRVQFHADQDVSELQRFWGTLLGVEPMAIHLQRKSNSGQLSRRSWRCRYGVLTVRVGIRTSARGSRRGWTA